MKTTCLIAAHSVAGQQSDLLASLPAHAVQTLLRLLIADLKGTVNNWKMGDYKWLYQNNVQIHYNSIHIRRTI